MREILIDLLSKGYSQNEIAESMKNKNVKGVSKSSIEKKIKELKKEFNAKTYFQLGYIIGSLKGTKKLK